MATTTLLAIIPADKIKSTAPLKPKSLQPIKFKWNKSLNVALCPTQRGLDPHSILAQFAPKAECCYFEIATVACVDSRVHVGRKINAHWPHLCFDVTGLCSILDPALVEVHSSSRASDVGIYNAARSGGQHLSKTNMSMKSLSLFCKECDTTLLWDLEHPIACGMDECSAEVLATVCG